MKNDKNNNEDNRIALFLFCTGYFDNEKKTEWKAARMMVEF